MSGPITQRTGTSDGISWFVDDGFHDPTAGGGDMIVPPAQHFPEITVPPSYYTGPTPYYGDFQIQPSGFLSALSLTIGFDKPIKQVRVTAQYVSDDGLAMYAVKDESMFVGIGHATFTAMKSVVWDQGVSGTRTLTVPEGFQYIVFRTLSVNPFRSGQLYYGPTFRNMFFFEEIPVAPVVEVPSPDVSLPPGAGRTLSLSWPIPNLTNASFNGFINIRPFPRTDESFPITEASIGVPTSGMNYRHGRQALRITCPTGSTRLYVPPENQTQPYSICTAFEQAAKANVGILDDFLCWRVCAMMSFDNPLQPVPGGMGLTLAAFGNRSVRGSAQAGIFLGCTDDSTIRLSIRGVNGGDYIYDAPLDLGGGFDLTHWHKYELRILGATNTSPAILKVMVDGVVLLLLPWTDGLPIPVNGSAFTFRWYIGNQNGGAGTAVMYLAAHGLEVHAAATEDALL